MTSSSEQEQISRLKKHNERLTILCLILGVISIASGLYARIEQSSANENQHIAAVNAKRAAEEKERAEELTKEAMRQRAIAESIAAELATLKQTSKKAK